MAITMQQMVEKITSIEKKTKEIFFRLEALETKKINKNKSTKKETKEGKDIFTS